MSKITLILVIISLFLVTYNANGQLQISAQKRINTKSVCTNNYEITIDIINNSADTITIKDSPFFGFASDSLDPYTDFICDLKNYDTGELLDLSESIHITQMIRFNSKRIEILPNTKYSFDYCLIGFYPLDDKTPYKCQLRFLYLDKDDQKAEVVSKEFTIGMP